MHHVILYPPSPSSMHRVILYPPTPSSMYHVILYPLPPFQCCLLVKKTLSFVFNIIIGGHGRTIAMLIRAVCLELNHRFILFGMELFICRCMKVVSQVFSAWIVRGDLSPSPPGWDTSPSQVTSQHFVTLSLEQFSGSHLDGERHCES